MSPQKKAKEKYSRHIHDILDMFHWHEEQRKAIMNISSAHSGAVLIQGSLRTAQIMVAAAQIRYVLNCSFTALIFAPSHGATNHLYNIVKNFQRGKYETEQPICLF